MSTNTQKLLERVRGKVPKGTDYAIAKALEISQSYLSRLLDATSIPGPKVVTRISELLSMDHKTVTAYIEADRAEREKNERDREFWRMRIPRLLPAVGFALTLALAGIPRTGNGSAGVAMANSTTSPAMHYANQLRAWLQRVIRAFGAWTSVTPTVA